MLLELEGAYVEYPMLLEELDGTYVDTLMELLELELDGA